MKTYKFEVVGKVESVEYVGSTYIKYQTLYKWENGVYYIQNDGRFTSSGVINNFTPLQDCEIVDGYVIVWINGSVRGSKKNVLSLYNKQIELTNKKWGYSYGELPLLIIDDLISATE